MRLFNDNCVGFVNRQCATSPACRMAWRGNRRPRASRNGHGETAGGSVQAGMGAARRPEAESKAEWARRGPVGESSGTAGRLRAPPCGRSRRGEHLCRCRRRSPPEVGTVGDSLIYCAAMHQLPVFAGHVSPVDTNGPSMRPTVGPVLRACRVRSRHRDRQGRCDRQNNCDRQRDRRRRDG